MVTVRSKKNTDEDLVQCSVCGDYFRSSEAFLCPKCKRSPLCKKHRAPGSRVCVSCTIDLKLKEVRALNVQEYNIKNFIRFLLFVLIFFVVVFISLRLGIGEDIDIIKNNIFTNNLKYIGAGTVVLYVIFNILLFGQRKKIAEIESYIEKIEVKKY